MRGRVLHAKWERGARLHAALLVGSTRFESLKSCVNDALRKGHRGGWPACHDGGERVERRTLHSCGVWVGVDSLDLRVGCWDPRSGTK